MKQLRERTLVGLLLLLFRSNALLLLVMLLLLLLLLLLLQLQLQLQLLLLLVVVLRYPQDSLRETRMDGLKYIFLKTENPEIIPGGILSLD